MSSSWVKKRNRKCFWAFHRERKQKYFWALQSVLTREEQATDSWGGTSPSPLQWKDERICFFSLWRILIAPKMQGEASNKCLYLFWQQNQSVVRHLCRQLAVTNSSSWDSSLVRIAVQRPCLFWLRGQESVPTNRAEALPVLLGHCRGCAHLQGVLVVSTFSGRWVFCKKAS